MFVWRVAYHAVNVVHCPTILIRLLFLFVSVVFSLLSFNRSMCICIRFLNFISTAYFCYVIIN